MILVVDDDRTLREALGRELTRGGFEVELAASGEQALESLVESMPDAVVLDVGLPGIDGLELCRRVRRLGNRVPILMLGGPAAVSDRIHGLDVGADDYLVKPFDTEELQARLRALLRRSSPSNGAGPPPFAELALDPARSAALVSSELVALTRTEFLLLDLLMRNPGHVLARSAIYEGVWGYDFGVASNTLRVYVGYVRRKLRDAGARELIHTVRGVGYVLREP